MQRQPHTANYRACSVHKCLQRSNLKSNTNYKKYVNNNTTIIKISSSFENKHYCLGVFLDVAQTFDRVYHTGLLYKIKLPVFFSAPLYSLICSYLENRTFKVCHGNSFSSLFPILAEVPQGSDLSPDLYNIFTSDTTQTQNTTLATYVDDTSFLSSNSNLIEAFTGLQQHLYLMGK